MMYGENKTPRKLLCAHYNKNKTVTRNFVNIFHC